VWNKALESLAINRMEQDEEIFARLMNDRDFQAFVSNFPMDQVYNQIRTTAIR